MKKKSLHNSINIELFSNSFHLFHLKSKDLCLDLSFLFSHQLYSKNPLQKLTMPYTGKDMEQLKLSYVVGCEDFGI